MPRIRSLALLAVMASAFQQEQFKTAVDLVAVEVSVVDKDGTPIGNLTAADFEVWISGRLRKIVTMNRLSYGSTAPTPVSAPAGSGDLVQPAAPATRRMFVLAIDEHSLQAGSRLAAVTAAERFIDKL